MGGTRNFCSAGIILFILGEHPEPSRREPLILTYPIFSLFVIANLSTAAPGANFPNSISHYD